MKPVCIVHTAATGHFDTIHKTHQPPDMVSDYVSICQPIEVLNFLQEDVS